MSQTGADQLTRDLAATLGGELMSLSTGLRVADLDAGVEQKNLLDPAHVTAILAWYDAKLKTPLDRRPALSIWASWHFQAVLPTIFAANILFDKTPRLSLDQVKFMISADHKADQLIISPYIDELGTTEEVDRFAPMVWDYLAPIIHLIAGKTGVTERVLWSNAGHVLEQLLPVLRPLAEDRPGFRAAERLFAASAWVGRPRNPLFKPVIYVDEQRFRRICCMRYLFPDGKVCVDCPMNLQSAPRQSDRPLLFGSG